MSAAIKADKMLAETMKANKVTNKTNFSSGGRFGFYHDGIKAVR